MNVTAQELYDLFDLAGLDYELIEIFEGARLISFQVEEDEEDEE